MAEQLDMGRLNLNDSQHAPGGPGFPDRAAYIPPHLRGRPPPAQTQMDGPGPMMNGGGANGAPAGLHGSAWGPAPG
jgi:ATP-dependent RNA helicase DDX3X